MIVNVTTITVRGLGEIMYRYLIQDRYRRVFSVELEACVHVCVCVHPCIQYAFFVFLYSPVVWEVSLVGWYRQRSA